MASPYVSRSGRVIKKPESYIPQEKPEDDFRDDEYDDSETDPDEDENVTDEEDEDDEEDEEDADENGNLKGFIVESESESDCDEISKSKYNYYLMETDISRNMGEMFEPTPLDQQRERGGDHSDYQPPQYHQYEQPPFQQPLDYGEKKTDFFADIDKKTWIFILIALILGFFMGKTMQIQPIMMRSV